MDAMFGTCQAHDTLNNTCVEAIVSINGKVDSLCNIKVLYNFSSGSQKYKSIVVHCFPFLPHFFIIYIDC